MNTTKVTLLRILARNIQQYQKNWCFMSQEKMLLILEKIYRIKIHRRALNYQLASLRKQGYIISIRRTHREIDGTICLMTSATCLTQQACKFLIRFGYNYFKGVLKRLRSKYFNPERPTNEPLNTPGRLDVDKISDDERKRLMVNFYKAFPKPCT